MMFSLPQGRGFHGKKKTLCPDWPVYTALFSNRSHKVDVWVGVDLCLLQGGQLRSVQSQSLFRSERATQLCGDPSVPNSVWTGGVSGALTGFSAVANKYDRHIIMNKSPFFALEEVSLVS